MSKLSTIMMWRGTYFITGLFVLLIGAYFIFVTPESKLQDPIKAQLSAIRMDDIAAAYAYTTTTFQKTTSLEAFRKFVYDYSALRNNDRIKFNDGEINRGVGIVKATLVGRGGSKTPILYQLAQEHNRWKIESMVIIPEGDDGISDVTSNKLVTDATPKPLTPTAEPAPVSKSEATSVPAYAASKTYQDPNDRYTLSYPANWQYTPAEGGALIMRKADSAADSTPVISIQPVIDSGDSTHFSVNQLVEQGEATIKEKAGAYKIVEDGLLPPRANKNENFHGRYVVYSYMLGDQNYKQLQVIYFRSPARAQYVFDFISTESEFDADLPAARSIISSFTVL